jgi:HEAT repeat protein
MDFKELEEKIQKNEDDAIQLIKQIGDAGNRAAIPFLLKHLKNTEYGSIRNAIALALALADIGDPCFISTIIELLQDPKTLGNRGTLVFSLMEYDCSEYVEVFIDGLINGNYEVRWVSSDLIENLKSRLVKEDVEKYITRIGKEIDELESKIHFLSITRDVLADRKN